MIQIDRKSSIESEPRALGIDQIQFARVGQSIILFYFLNFCNMCVNFYGVVINSRDVNLVCQFGL